jgi:predicted N-acetyltransferase YhbS
MGSPTEISKIESGHLSIRPLQQRDLDGVDRIFRLAFGTFLGLPNPEVFSGDSDCIRTRWLANPAATLGAELDGSLVGSNFVTRWGSVGFFGPLTVHPSFWERGIAKKLLAPTVDMLDGWHLAHAGLFTFGHSPKHAALYQKFDFWPRFLTMIMSKPVAAKSNPMKIVRFSALPLADKNSMLKECYEVTDSIYPGLDVEYEIRAVDDQRLGDTVLLMGGSRLEGFAVCHCGAGSEAGSGACYVKFAAIKSGHADEQHFAELLKNCEEFAAVTGSTRLIAGVNTSRCQAYRSMLAQGFRTEFQGVVMQRGNEIGYNREGVYLIDDWR